MPLHNRLVISWLAEFHGLHLFSERRQIVITAKIKRRRKNNNLRYALPLLLIFSRDKNRDNDGTGVETKYGFFSFSVCFCSLFWLFGYLSGFTLRKRLHSKYRRVSYFGHFVRCAYCRLNFEALYYVMRVMMKLTVGLLPVTKDTKVPFILVISVSISS